jgi:hypothetical protein
MNYTETVPACFDSLVATSRFVIRKIGPASIPVLEEFQKEPESFITELTQEIVNLITIDEKDSFRELKMLAVDPINSNSLNDSFKYHSAHARSLTPPGEINSLEDDGAYFLQAAGIAMMWRHFTPKLLGLDGIRMYDPALSDGVVPVFNEKVFNHQERLSAVLAGGKCAEFIYRYGTGFSDHYFWSEFAKMRGESSLFKLFGRCFKVCTSESVGNYMIAVPDSLAYETAALETARQCLSKKWNHVLILSEAIKKRVPSFNSRSSHKILMSGNDLYLVIQGLRDQRIPETVA